MKEEQFKLSTFLKPKEQFHLARVTINSLTDLPLHSHEYAELAWVEKGSGIHHVNGLKIKLSPGKLIMIRPSDRHAFSSKNEGITIVNIAFKIEALECYKQRYFLNSDTYFWSDSLCPYHTQLSLDTIRRLSTRVEHTMCFERTNLQLDSLVLFVFRLLLLEYNVEINHDLPLWLFKAIQIYRTYGQYKNGVQEFVGLCERNIDYINRTIQKQLNKSLTTLVNEIKIQHAASQLSLTNIPIKRICIECGYKNIGHFYKIFKEVHNQTPYEYRKINQTIV